MTESYRHIAEHIATEIADGTLAAGAPLEGVRTLASRHRVSPATMGRAVQMLAAAGIVRSQPRVGTRVATDGHRSAHRWLSPTPHLRLAGSDDPALAVLLEAAAGTVEPLAAGGSGAGLTALWSGQADAATLHLQAADGEYNRPFAARALASRRPRLLRLWQREQGILMRREDARRFRGVADLQGMVVALRPTGSGTWALWHRLSRQAGLPPDTVGPCGATHVDVAVAVASGAADAGLAVRGAAALLDLSFLPLLWEPFEMALPADQVDAAAGLRDALHDPVVIDRITALGGYDLSDAGTLVAVG